MEDSSGVGTMSAAPVELPALVSLIPSVRLEHEAQMLGLRDRVFPFSSMGSPQQMQMRRLIGFERKSAIPGEEPGKPEMKIGRLVRSPCAAT